MRKTFKYQPKNYSVFKESLLKWANRNEVFCILDSNGYYASDKLNNTFSYHKYETIAGVGKISDFTISDGSETDAFREYLNSTNDWLMGHISYDFKNFLEKLSSKNKDLIGFQPLYFFQPKLIFNFVDNHSVEIFYIPEITSIKELKILLSSLEHWTQPYTSILETNNTVFFNPNITREDYISKINSIKKHIYKGNIYELNYCINFFAEQAGIDPVGTWLKLVKASPAPFSCLYKIKDKYLISSSPERFIQKTGNDIISQPMKGTIKRGKNEKQDEQLKKQLFRDVKERSENVMITDLVRNDLSKIALKKSVKVEEQCGLYTYKNVHQLITTVTAKVDKNISPLEVIKAAFPMGSMTGAPKIRAMQLIDLHETFARGLYSGTVGYINPQNDFDFNVVIRSILYNQSVKTVCIHAGSAITALSDPEYEYDECMLKARALLALFEN